MSFVIQVIDLNCEGPTDGFFTPQIQLTAESTTTTATVLGYSEFVKPSTPPKKYRKVTVSGFSRRVAFTCEQTPSQCGGAQLVWSGVGEIDLSGNVISNFTKNFYAQCNKQFWPAEPLQTLSGAIRTSDSLTPVFTGFCWSGNVNSCAFCDPTVANWPFINDQATHNPAAILTDMGSVFLKNPSDLVETKTTFSVNGTFYGLTSIQVNPSYSALASGPGYTVLVGGRSYSGQAAVTTPPLLDFAVVWLDANDGNGQIVGGYINFTDTNAYSAVLSEEYTDADAAAHAVVTHGTSTTAQNLPRTTGFSSVTTDVTFTLLCLNLISGRNYTATVNFEDVDTGDSVKKSYDFTADDVTHTITDTILKPIPGQSVQVKNPKIAFSP